MAAYLDSSAIVKLVVAEPESMALRRYLRRRTPFVSSALARTEVIRALNDEGDPGVARGRTVLSRIELIRVGNAVLDAAGVMAPSDLRSLDAIHLATAQLIGSDLDVFIAYDERLLDAARAVGLRTASPG